MLVDCKNKGKIAEKLRNGCPDIEEDVTVLIMYVKKPPPVPKPWG